MGLGFAGSLASLEDSPLELHLWYDKPYPRMLQSQYKSNLPVHTLGPFTGRYSLVLLAVMFEKCLSLNLIVTSHE